MIRTILFFLFVGIFVLHSCNEKPAKRNTVKSSTESENYLSKIDSLLPGFINNRDYIIVYRFGSIQWSPVATILCIPKNELGKNKLNLLYFVCNVDPIINIPGELPSFIMFSIKMNNPDVTMEKLNLSSLTELSFTDFEKLKFERYSKEHLGEGFCSNYYVIRSASNNQLFLLDKTNKESQTNNYLKEIFRHISPMEYTQSLSLEKQCDTMTVLPDLLRNGKFHDLDSFNFSMKQDLSKYW